MESKKSIVLHVNPSMSWGGAEIYTINLVEALRQAGINAILWCQKDSRLAFEGVLRKVPLLTDSIPDRWAPWYLPRLTQVIRRIGATHLHCHWSGGGWAFAGVKFFTNVKLIYHNHMWIKHKKKDPFHALVYSAFDALIVAGPRARAAALTHLPILDSKIFEIPYFVPLNELSKFSREDGRRSWQLPQDAFIFGMFGRIDRQKGVLEFVKGVEPVLRENPHARALVVGDPTHGEMDALKYLREIQNFVDVSSQKGQYVFLPHQSDFRSLLKACDVLVAPSYHESYALIFLHAFDLGIPAISTDAGGTPDLVADGERGWLVPPRSVLPLTEAFKLAMRGEESVVRGQKGRIYVECKHSQFDVIEMYRKLYSLLTEDDQTDPFFQRFHKLELR